MADSNPIPRGEEEPLLGQPGDASQHSSQGIQNNLVMGTAALAQAGIWILAAIVWAAAFNAPPLMLFHVHPLVNSAGLLFIVQGILILQPTHAPKQKQTGTIIHSILNGTGLLALIAGFVVIEYNKFDHGADHFTSAHGKMGLVTYIIFILQGLVGITQYYTPALYGSVDNAKAVWKYHRMSGYALLVLSLATVCSATYTGFNTDNLHIQLWSVTVASILIVVGVGARIHLQKLGLKK